MESTLEKALSDITSTTNVTGCVFANKQGLCLGAKGIANPMSSGMSVAISKQACKLEPNANPPIIALESGNKTCIIHKYGDVTGMIYKEIPNPR